MKNMKSQRWIVSLVVAFGASLGLFTHTAAGGLAPLVVGSLFGTPSVVIHSPAHGEFVGPGTPFLVVTGEVFGVAYASAAVSVNGQTAVVKSDGTFTAVVLLSPATVFRRIEARVTELATGASGVDHVVVVRGDHAPRDALVDSAVFLRFMASGIDELDDYIDDLATTGIPKSYLSPGLLIPDYCAGNTWDGSDCVDVILRDPVTFAAFDVDVTPNDGGVLAGQGPDYGYTQVDVGFSGLYVPLLIDAQAGAPWDDDPYCSVDVYANGSIGGRYKMADQIGAPGTIDVSMQFPSVPTVKLSWYDVQVYGCGNAGADDLQKALIEASDEIAVAVSETIESHLYGSAAIESALEDALAAIHLASPIGNALGLDLRTGFRAIQEDDQGIDFLVRTSVEASPDSLVVPPLLEECFVRPVPDPKLGICFGGGLAGKQCSEDWQCASPLPSPCKFFTPKQLQPYDAALAISSTPLNQMLRAQVEEGGLTGTISEVDLGLGGGPAPITVAVAQLLIPGIAVLGLDPAQELEIQVRPTFAPVVDGRPGPHDEAFAIEIADLRLALVLRGQQPIELPDLGGIDLPFELIDPGLPGTSRVGVYPGIPSCPACFGRIEMGPTRGVEAKLFDDPYDPLHPPPDLVLLEMAVDLRAGLDFVLTSDDEIAPKIAAIEQSDVRFAVPVNPYGANEALLALLVVPQVPALLPSLVSDLEPFSLPTAGSGIALDVAEVAVIGDPEAGRHLVLYLNVDAD